MRSTAFFKIYKMCTLLHRCDLKMLAKNRFEKTAIFVKFQQKIANIAKFAKCCQISRNSAWESGRFWKMLSNAYLLAKIGADTAENEERFAEILPTDALWRLSDVSTSRPAPLPAGALRRRRQRASVGKISARCCSFSAVSAPIFARKYAFCSIFQNLPDSQAEIFEIWQHFANFATFAIFCWNFTKIAVFSNRFFAKILRLQRCKRMQIL